MGIELKIKVYVVTHETETGLDVYVCKSLDEVEKLKFDILDDRPESERVDWSIHNLEWSL